MLIIFKRQAEKDYEQWAKMNKFMDNKKNLMKYKVLNLYPNSLHEDKHLSGG